MLGRAIAYAYLGVTVWLAGYLYGHRIGRQDSPDKGPSFGEQVDEWVRESHEAHAEGNGG